MTCSTVVFDALGAYVERDPDATLSIGFSWVAWLAERGYAALDTSTWAATAGVTISGDTFAEGITSVLNSGGAADTDYTLTNTITAGAETDVRRVRVKVRPT